MNNIFIFFIIALISVPILGTVYGDIEELGSVLPTKESLPGNWALSKIELIDDRSLGPSGETIDIAARQYLIRDQVNENSMILVTLSINEFSSPSVSSDVFEDHTNSMSQLEGTTMDTGSGCFGIMQDKNTLNETSVISCSVDEFIIVSTVQQNGIVIEEDNQLSTESISAGFATFLIKSLANFEHSALIPDWIKNNAKWWSDGTISDNEFVVAIEFLIKEDIISIQQGPPTTASSDIPPWVKTNAGWWADGIISDKEFVQSIEFMVNNGIITV